MEGVPVEISDRYRHATVEAPSAETLGAPSRATRLADGARYDFSLERNVLRRLDEWREARTAERSRREERIRRAEEEKRRAEEAAATLERLQLAEVTYPSADEIEEPAKPPEVPVAVAEDGILQPTRAPIGARVDLLDDLDDPIARLNSKRNRFSPLNGLREKNVDAMTFSDFENDTSSPFDNAELKSINDLELLAQVLNGPVADGAYRTTNAFPYAYDANLAIDPAVRREDESARYATSNFNYYAPGYAYPEAALRPFRTVHSSNEEPSYGTAQNFYTAGRPTYYVPTVESVPERDPDAEGARPLSKSRSKSVPDIVKELDEEIAEARLRFRERSHDSGPRRTEPETPAPDPFAGLSPKLRSVCESINGMGFPIDRVARACKDIGDDDKKIVEYLLLMGQLMDLGFSESKVAEALLRHDCNRDEALDELIS